MGERNQRPRRDVTAEVHESTKNVRYKVGTHLILITSCCLRLLGCWMSKLAGWWSKKLEGGKREGMSRKTVCLSPSGLVQTGIYTFLRVLPVLSIYITKHYLLDDKCPSRTFSILPESSKNHQECSGNDQNMGELSPTFLGL